jgi:predicted RND superfamily exporter protein
LPTCCRRNHEYIKVYNRLKENFGGANMIVMAVEVEKGTIFNDETLKLIHEATQGVDNLPSVNHNLVSSLTHRTARKVFLSAEGSFVSQPYYDPQKPSRSVAELEALKADVIANPTLYGLLVSPDLKAALIKAQLNESELDYVKTFAELQKVREAISKPGHQIHVTGNPVLTGWVYTYLNQIIAILMPGRWLLLAALLILYFRRLYGIALAAAGHRAVLDLGARASWRLVGINLEPLSLPIPFLIAARATSHGVQLVVRYYEELAIVPTDGKQAARNALDALFRPGSLAIIVDAVGIAVLVLGAAPVQLQARYGGRLLGLLGHLHGALHGAAGADRAAGSRRRWTPTATRA